MFIVFLNNSLSIVFYKVKLLIKSESI